jgi:hypothetical protein
MGIHAKSFSPFFNLHDSLMWEGESMQRDGMYWLVCAASRVSVDNAKDEAVALSAYGGSQLPCACWNKRTSETVAHKGELGLLKLMCEQKPPCPCDLVACLRLEDEGGGSAGPSRWGWTS